jgi:hypothetical protein
MSDLVVQTCEVRCNGDDMFFLWDAEDTRDALSPDADEDIVGAYESYKQSRICGLPAFSLVSYGETQVWMCLQHFNVATQGTSARSQLAWHSRRPMWSISQFVSYPPENHE